MMATPAPTRDATGLLLVGHGTRDPRGVEEFFTLARLVAARAVGHCVEPCFLEFAEPTIPAGFARLMARGVSCVEVAPIMLFSAAHVQRDIPALIADQARRHGRVPTRQVEHLGCQADLLRLSQLRCDEATADRAAVESAETALVMVGRGSHDPSATEEMHAFAALRAKQTSLTTVRASFVAMAEPRFEATLDVLAGGALKRIVVQPHLLFGGVLVGRIAAIVAGYADRYRAQEWIVAPHLGPHELLAQAVLERVAGPAGRAKR